MTFGFLGWSFYELSGGGDYAPRSGSLQAGGFSVFAPVAPAATINPAPPSSGDEVARAAFDPGELPRVNVSLPSIAAPDRTKPVFEKARVVSAATTPTAPAPEAVPAPEPQSDLREISGNVVNMRMGPGTKFNVATTLRRGDLVEVLDDPGTGWLNLRVVDTGRVGWIADFLVTAGLD
ncbi:SH3 domain-containing protein [Lutimaribacter sp. EGI FJ00013]|uniref:SH3 domain-containing protein n=1 Tax=Lutimaribacter degradans TaxID=2945989 RepID=A0ACC5ZWI1_9RHOB|nr:SH3 domain-containing protein [Lutimaribacter sp. EGI FJ00013]